MSIIQVESLSFTYRGSTDPALRNVSLTVEPGEFVGLIGPTGAGKSTLCWALVGVVPEILRGRLEGKVTVCGLAPNHTPVADVAQAVGLVQQDAEAQLLMTDIEKEIVFPLENLSLPQAEISRRLEEVLDLVQLRPDRLRHPFYLSGGQKQRVAVAAVLAMQPEVLVLDEATSELDPLGAEQVLELAGQLKAKGKTILMVEHNIDELAKHADHIIVMDRGEKVRDGSAREILSDVPFLTRLGIYPPQVTQVAYHLAERGLYGGELPLTIEEGLTKFRELEPGL